MGTTIHLYAPGQRLPSQEDPEKLRFGLDVMQKIKTSTPTQVGGHIL
jgi:hypothetical protein